MPKNTIKMNKVNYEISDDELIYLIEYLNKHAVREDLNVCNIEYDGNIPRMNEMLLDLLSKFNFKLYKEEYDIGEDKTNMFFREGV